MMCLDSDYLGQMKKKSRKGKGMVLLAILLVATVFTLAGCIGQEEKPLTTTIVTTKPGETIPVTITQTIAPEKEEIVLNYAAQQVIGTMDPAEAVDETDLISTINLYSTLVYPDIEHKSPQPVYHVAESWDVSPDKTVYTFHLRDDVKFHDGSPLLAEDVVYSAERFIALGMGFSWAWAGVLESGNIVATDDHTVEFRLNRPYPPFIATLVVFFIVNKDLLVANQESGDYGEFGDYGVKYLQNHDAGSGPYMLESWVRGEKAVFVKFPNYFRGWRSLSIDRVNFQIVREEATALLIVKTGDADLSHQWFTVEAHEELAAEPHISMNIDPGLQLFHLPINTQKPPTDDVNFRYAICYAFDYDTACNKIQKGAPQARGSVPIILPANSENAFQFHYNMTLAREYLTKSKYAPDQYTLEYVYVTGIELERKIGLLLQASLAELGIPMTITGVPWGTITEIAATVEDTPHLTAIYDTMKFPHVDSHTYGLYHSTVPSTYRTMSHYSNPEVDAALDAARAAVTEEEQIKKYKEAQDLYTLDAPSVYIFNTPHRVETWDYLTGYTYVGLLGYDMSWWYFGLDTDLREMWIGGSVALLSWMQALVVIPAGYRPN